MLKIAVVDAYTAAYGGLSWEDFQSLGETTCYDRTAPAELLERAGEADALIVNKVIVNRAVMEALPRLRYIGVTATGTNNVDLIAAAELGIAVTNVPAYSAEAVAQMVFAHVLHATSHVASYDAMVKEGAWAASPDFCFFKDTIRGLAGKTLGIVGLGDIGKKVRLIGEAFGMQTAAAAVPGRAYEVPRPKLEEVLAAADVLTLHCPLTPATSGLICKAALELMKPDAILVNTSRGGLVNEYDLAEALRNGRLGWACLDVLAVEPPPRDYPLLKSPRLSVTPHIAWGTKESRRRLIAEAAANLAAFQRGESRNRRELPSR